MSEKVEKAEEASLVKRALHALESMRAKAAALEYERTEPIAIIGMGCRFPGGANSVESYWQLLHEGREAIKEVPADRWNIDTFYDSDPDAPGKMYTRWGGFLDHVDLFDPAFFGITPREATSIDPQQRLVLEVAWEALENSGLVPEQLSGSKTGVFIGVSNNEYSWHEIANPKHINAYSGTGNAYNVIAGRLSYLLNLQGPSMAVDTACSSSLLSIHLACQSLRNKESHLALAGGVNLMLAPQGTIVMTKIHALSGDGRCKTFDARADGFVRSEGCGMVVLKRLSDAQADGDPILALVRGSAINQDGRSSGLTAPNVAAQCTVLREALASARVAPELISYVETHGTGTPLGDPIEVEALTEVLAHNQPSGPCVLGAVKTNMGHLEAAAGVAGLIKVVLAMQHEEIPGNLHFNELNPNIRLKGTHFVVPTTNQPWSKSEQRRYAGVSAFGWAGTNAHMILEEAPGLLAPSEQVEPESGIKTPEAHILPLAARSQPALQALIESYRVWLAQHAELSAYDICAAASLHRTHHDYRAALIGATPQALIEQAQIFLEEDITVEPILAGQRKVVFVFAGQGTHYVGMGLQLLEQEPVFREQLQRCDQLLQQYVPWSLLDELAAPPERSRLNQIEIAQPVLFSLQISLAALWQAWGMLPTAVIGHSVGEVAAAYVAGALSLAQALQLVALRGQLLQEAEGSGDMALVEVAATELEQLLQPWQGRVEIAARNSPTTTVLSGEPQALEEVVEQMQQQGFFARLLHVGFASHCRQMAPYAERLQAALEQDASWQPGPTQVPFFSTVQQRRVPGEVLDARYWGRNVVEPVGFAETMQVLLADSSPCLLEISPHPILRHALRQCVRAYAVGDILAERGKLGSEEAVAGSLQRERAERETLLQSLSQLYSQGVKINWSGVYRRREQMVGLPTYPFQRERFWHEGWKNGREEWLDFQSKEQVRHPLFPLETRSSVEAGVWYWDGMMSVERTEYLGEHRLQGTVVVAGAVYLEGVITAAQRRYAGSRVQLEQVRFLHMLTLPEHPDESQHLQLALIEDTKEPAGTEIEGRQVRFQFSSRGTEQDLSDTWKVHATGILRLDSESKRLPDGEQLAGIKARCPQVCTQAEIYARLDAQGTNYGPAFQGIEQIWLGEQEALARLQLPESLERDVDGYWLHPAFLDACLHVSLVMQHFAEANSNRQNIAMPVYVETIRIHQRPGKQIWSHVRFSQENGGVIGTTHLLNEKGDILVELIGSRIQQLEEIQKSEVPSSTTIQDWFYNLNWRSGTPLVTDHLSRIRSGTWWIFADDDGFGNELATLLESRGEQAILVFSGSAFEQKTHKHFCISPERPADIERLYATLLEAGSRDCCGIIHLWSMNSVSNDHVTVDALDAGHMQGSGSLLHLVQMLARTSWPQEPPRLWLVTQGAQHLETDKFPVALVQSMLWGFGRGIAQEHADLWGGLVDLEAGADRRETALQLWEHIQADDGEDQVALRQQQRYVARLERQQVPARSDVPLVWQTNASYLITGGLGGLGSGLAHWMVQQGARHIILMGRTALPPRRQWSQIAPQHDLYPTVTHIRELEGMGASIHLATVDVADETQLTAFLDTYKEEGWPPIRGVVHAAGVSHYQPIQELNVDVLRADFQPKVVGSWLLYQALRDEALDFFVLFSSAAVLLSPAFLASYAASNAFLDALAHYGRAQGRTILSINWGYWSQIGMVAHLQQETYSLIAKGISAMRPEQGLEVFNYLQRSYTGAQMVVMPVNWSEWKQYYPGAANSPYLSQLIEAGESESEAGNASASPTSDKVTSQMILSLPHEERLSHLITYLQQRMARIFHVAPASLDIQQPINKLGLDSLMALELKIQITVDLDVTFSVVKMLQGPSIVQLATQLLDQMLLATLVQSAASSTERNGDYEEIEL